MAMNDQDKTREQLIEELAELRQRLASVESAADRHRQLKKPFQDSEGRFHSIIQHSYDAVVLVDSSGTFTYTSPSTFRVLGDRAKELLGRNGFDLIHPNDLNTAQLKFAEALERPKNIVETEFRVQHKDTSWRWVEVTATNLLDEPAVQGVVVNFRDITEHRQAKEALNQSEERFRSLIERSYGAVVLIDASGTFTYTSPSIHRILGYQAEQLLGTYGFDLVHPDDVNTALLKFAGILQSPKSMDNMEVRVQHKDTGWRWFEVIGTNLLDEPAVQGVVVNFWDITERKQAEAALRRSTERLRQAQEAGRVGIWQWDLLTGHIVWDGLDAIHGLEPGAFRGPFEAYLEYVHPEDRETISKGVARTLEQGAELRDLGYRIIWPEGSVHWIEGRGQAHQDQEGRMVRIVRTCQDITQRKEAENQIATALAQLEAVLESVDAGILLMGEDNDTVLWANQNYGDFFDVADIESMRGDPKLTQVLRQHVEANAVFDRSLNELRAVVLRDRTIVDQLVR